jgi:hypothetical protein
LLAMAGLNIRLNKAGNRLYFKNRGSFIACVNLEDPQFQVLRVYNIKEIKELVKFEADCVGSDIVALSQDGMLKASEKNLCYNLASESKFI